MSKSLIRFNEELQNFGDQLERDGLGWLIDLVRSQDKEISGLKADLLKKTEALLELEQFAECGSSGVEGVCFLPTTDGGYEVLHHTDLCDLIVHTAKDALDTLDQKEEGE